MPRLLALLIAVAAVVAAAGGVVLSRDSGEPAIERESGEELQEPGDAILARQLSGSDTDPARAARRAVAAARSAPTVSAPWQFVGPSNIGGRALDVAVDPSRPDTIYAATAGGGVMRSQDGGRTFTSAWPDDLTQAIGTIAITPGGVLFAGTGEAGPGGGSLTFGGTGVYRSTDRGATWQLSGLPNSSRIGRIVVDPKDERRIFVAAGGPLYKPGGERGLYLSTDGGDSWARVLEGANDTTGASDVAIDPSDSNHVFATTWDLLREPDKRRYTGPGSGLYESTDGGKTWAPALASIFGPGDPELSRIGVAFAHSDPKVVYVILSTESGAHGGLWKSTDGGATFTPTSTDPSLIEASYTYGWWFGRVFVDPKDAAHVYVPGVNFPESKDGGLTWNDVPGVHSDQHGLAWDAKAPGRVYLANDGGIYHSEDDGGRWTHAESQPFHQLYSLDVSQQDPSRMTAGLQDNGAVRSYPEKWNEYVGGDGQRTLINPVDQDIVYGCYQYGECSKSTDGGNTTSSFTNQVVSSRKNWFTPIEFDPQNPSTLYSGGEILNRSTDDAATWQPISPDLTNGPGRETNPLFKNYGTITTIAPGPAASGIIYAGTDDGNLWVSRSDAAPPAPLNWVKATDPDLPKAWVTRVEADPRDPTVAYVTYSGFRQADDAAYILRTRDAGTNWENVTGDLPRAPLNDVNLIGDDLYVASDVGVFRSRDGGGHWERVGSLPLAPIFELRYHAPTGALYAATFGRGIYRVALADVATTPAPAPAPAAPAAPVSPVPRLRILPANACVRNGRLAIRIRGAKLRSARVTVRGRRAVALRGAKLRRTLVLRRLRGSRVRVVVTAVAADGRRLKVTRTFRRCGRR